MRIAVVGAGGVGGYIGAKLSLSGRDDEVIFVARGEHAETIREKGLRVIEDEGELTAHPSAVVTADALEGSVDLLLLCVKSYDIADALTALRPAITQKSIIIPFANGVEHSAAIASMADARILNGCAYILSHIEAPGVIRKQGKVFAAVFGGESEATAEVAALFDAAGLRCKTPENIEEAVWKKYLFISAFAALTTYYDMSIRRVYEKHGDEAQALLEEIAAVARARGVDIAAETEKALKTAAGLPEEASTSMHLDFQHRRRNELETLCGYIVREGERHGVATSVMKKIYDALKARE